MKIECIGKTLLIESGGKRVLVIGDLHLGYEESLNEGGVLVTRKMFEEMIGELNKIFEKISEKDAKIKKTMCHHTLKGAVCKGTCFLDAQGTNSILKDGVFVKFPDIMKDKKIINNCKKGGGEDDDDWVGGVSNISERAEHRRGERNSRIVDEIIFLGDIKHNFGRVLKQEWNDALNLFDFCKKFCTKIIITKGNHDNYLKNITSKRDFVSVADYYLEGEYCFLHGNKDFKEIWEGARTKEIKTLVVGHLHPAVTLQERGGAKSERYKCFLEGAIKRGQERKKLIIAPSFSEYSEGVDVGNLIEIGAGTKGNLAGDIDLCGFNVKIVDEKNLTALDFGLLKDLD